MKKCPNCSSEVENNFDLCWNCQYSFSDKRILDKKELTAINEKMDLRFKAPKNMDCLRCKVPITYQGNYKFHEGTRIGVLGNLFEFFVNRKSFDLYSCPNCGKAEFFLPIIDSKN